MGWAARTMWTAAAQVVGTMKCVHRAEARSSVCKPTDTALPRGHAEKQRQQHGRLQQKQRFAAERRKWQQHVGDLQDGRTAGQLEQLAADKQLQSVTKQLEHSLKWQQQCACQLPLIKISLRRLGRTVSLQEKSGLSVSCSRVNRREYSTAAARTSAAEAVPQRTQQMTGRCEERQQVGQAIKGKMDSRALRRIYTPVLIVGGGPVGLSFALLLRSMGVPCVVLEKQQEAGCQPKAHYCSNRSMEVWRTMEHLDEELDEATPSLDDWRHFSYCTHLVPSVKDQVSHIAARDHFEAHYTYTASDGKTKYFEAFSPCRMGHVPQHIVLPLLYSRIYEAAIAASSSRTAVRSLFSSSPSGDVATLSAAASPRGDYTVAAEASTLATCSTLLSADFTCAASAAASSSQDALPLYTRLFNEPLPPPSVALLPPRTQQRLLRLWNGTSSASSRGNSDCRNGNSTGDRHDSSSSSRKISHSHTNSNRRSSINNTIKTDTGSQFISATMLFASDKTAAAGSLDAVFLPEEQQRRCFGADQQQTHHFTETGRAEGNQRRASVRVNEWPQVVAIGPAWGSGASIPQQMSAASSCASAVRRETGSPAADNEQQVPAGTAVTQTVPMSSNHKDAFDEVIKDSFYNTPSLPAATMAAVHSGQSFPAATSAKHVARATATETLVHCFPEQHQPPVDQLQQQSRKQQQVQETQQYSLAEVEQPVPEVLFGTEWISGELKEVNESGEASGNDSPLLGFRSRYNSNRSRNSNDAYLAGAYSPTAAPTPSNTVTSSSSLASPSSPRYSPASILPSSPCSSFSSRGCCRVSGEDPKAASSTLGGKPLPGVYIQSLVRRRSKDGVYTSLLIDSAFVFACDGAKSTVAASLSEFSMQGVEEVQHLLNITFSSQHLASLIRSSQYLEEASYSQQRNPRSLLVSVGGGNVELRDSWNESRGRDVTVGEDSRSSEAVIHSIQGSSHHTSSSICATQLRCLDARDSSPSVGRQGSTYKRQLGGVPGEEAAAVGDTGSDYVGNSPHRKCCSYNSVKTACGLKEKAIEENSNKTTEQERLGENMAGNTEYGELSSRNREDGKLNENRDINPWSVTWGLAQGTHAADVVAADVCTEALAAAPSSGISEGPSSPPSFHSSPLGSTSLSARTWSPTSPATVQPPPLRPVWPSFTRKLLENKNSIAVGARVSRALCSSSRASVEGPVPEGHTNTVFPSSNFLPHAVGGSFSLVEREHHTGKRKCASPPSMLYYVMNEHVVGVVVLHSLSRGEFVAHVPYFPLTSSSCKKTRSSSSKSHDATKSSSLLPNTDIAAAPYFSVLLPTAPPAPVSAPSKISFSSPYLPPCACPHVFDSHAPSVPAFHSPPSSYPFVRSPAFFSLRTSSSSCSPTISFPFVSITSHLNRKDPSLSEAGPHASSSLENAFLPQQNVSSLDNSSLLYGETSFLPEEDNFSDRILPLPSSSTATTTKHAEEKCREAVQHLAGVKLRDLRIFEARGWRMTAKVANSFIFPFLPAASSSCTSPATEAGTPTAFPTVALSPVSSDPLSCNMSAFSHSSFPFIPPGARVEALAPCASALDVTALPQEDPPAKTRAANFYSWSELYPDAGSSYSEESQEMQRRVLWPGSVRQQLQQQKRHTWTQQQHVQRQTLQADEVPAQQQQAMRKELQQQPAQTGAQDVLKTAFSAKRAAKHEELSSTTKGKDEEEERTMLHQQATSPQTAVHCETTDSSPVYGTLDSSTPATSRSLPRIVLLGDAAHQLPPAGGLGMNLGIGDAVALAWRIAQIYHRGSALSVDCSGSNDKNSNSREGERIGHNTIFSSNREDRISSRCSSDSVSLRFTGGENSKTDLRGGDTEAATDKLAESKSRKATKETSAEDTGHVATAAAYAVHAWWRLLRSYDEERRLVAEYACSVAVNNFKRGLEIPAALGLDLRLGEKVFDTLQAAAATAERVTSVCFDWLRPDTLHRREEGFDDGLGAGSPSGTADIATAAATGSPSAAGAAPFSPGVGGTAATQGKTALDRAPFRLRSLKRKVTEMPFEIAKRTLDAVVTVAKAQMMLCRKWVTPLWERRKETVERILKDEDKNLGMIYYGVDLAYAYASSALYVHSPALLAPAVEALLRKTFLLARLSAAEEATARSEENAMRGAKAGETRATGEAAGQIAAGSTGWPVRPPAELMVSESPFYYEPTSWIGCRVPHTWLYCAVGGPPQRHQEAANYRISTVDLPFIHYPSCAYCFLVFSARHIHTLQEALVEAAEGKFFLPFAKTYSPRNYPLSDGPSGILTATHNAKDEASPTVFPVESLSSRAQSAAPAATTFSASPSSLLHFAFPSLCTYSPPADGSVPSASGDTLTCNSSSHALAPGLAQQKRILQSFAFAVCWKAAVTVDEGTARAPASCAGECEKILIHRRPFALPGGVAALQLLGSTRSAASLERDSHAAESKTAGETAAQISASITFKRVGDGESMCGKPDLRTRLQLQDFLHSEKSKVREGRRYGHRKDVEISRNEDSEMRSRFACKNEGKSRIDTRFVWSSTKRREAFLMAMEKEILRRLQFQGQRALALPLNREDLLVVLRPDAHILAISYFGTNGEDSRSSPAGASAAAPDASSPSTVFTAVGCTTKEASASADSTDARLKRVVLDIVRHLP